MFHSVRPGDASKILSAVDKREPELKRGRKVDLTFLDPPFNQGKEYDGHDDDMSPEEYWDWMLGICKETHRLSSEGASVYFMQREKNASEVKICLEGSGWTYQNTIIWKKKTSPTPNPRRYNKGYQVILFATKGRYPRVFNKVRIDPPPLPSHKVKRRGGLQLSDVWDDEEHLSDFWDDIRELTSGYLAGDEALRDEQGERIHKQQSPVALLLRIILVSSLPGDIVLDPFSGTGTTAAVAKQLGRSSISIENSARNVDLIRDRLKGRSEDSVLSLAVYYRHTPDLAAIWPGVESALPKSTIDEWIQKTG